MNAYEKIAKLTDKDFKLITGVTREVFYRMLEVLKQKYAEDHVQGGHGTTGRIKIDTGIGILARISFISAYGKRPSNRKEHNQQGRIVGRGYVKRIFGF